VTAQNQWWGSSSGPYYPTLNPGGTGDPVSNGVNFIPYRSYVCDAIPPFVSNIVRAGSSPTGISSVKFIVNFSEPVTGVNLTDFTLAVNGVSGATVGEVSASGTTYTVTVNTGSGNGTIRLDVADDDSIVDVGNNPLGAVGIGNGNFNSGATYTITKYYNPVSRWTSSFDLSHGWTVSQYVRTVPTMSSKRSPLT
jgi:hypothetical protein